MASLHHTQAGRVKKRMGGSRNYRREQEEDDYVVVEPEDWILGQLRGGPDTHTPGRRYFNILYEDKEEAKEHGAWWDKKSREWYARNDAVAATLAGMWGEMGLVPKVMFNVPVHDTEEAKELGARFCWEQKRWYASDMVTVNNMKEKWQCLTAFTAPHEGPQIGDPPLPAAPPQLPAGPPAPPTPEKAAPPTPAKRHSAHSQAKRRAAEDDTGDDEGNAQCVICWQEAKSVGFLHGGEVHVCACKECGDEWFKHNRTCPVCRRPAESTVTVFR